MYALREAVTGLLRARSMAIVSIATITVSLIVFTGIALMTVGANGVMDRIRGGEEITVYIEDTLTDGEMLALAETIRSMGEVATARIMSKEDAAREFETMFGEGLLEGLDENPLPRSIIVTLADGSRMSEDFDRVAGRIRGATGVEAVEYGSEWVSHMDIIFLAVVLTEIVIAGLVFSACMLVIANTITLTLIARRDAIEIMRLVGATEGFIRRPFYLEGFIQGFAAGVVTYLMMLGISAWIVRAVPQLPVYLFMFGFDRLIPVPATWALASIVPVGAVLGFVGSYIAVRRKL